MDKVEAKELIKAINSLAKTQQEHNKSLDKLISAIRENTEVNKETRTRLLTLSTSLDNVKFSQTNV